MVPEQCLRKRRRDGATVQARTEEPSSARVRIPGRQKAPRSLRRCLPSRGGIQGRPRPDRRGTWSSRPHPPVEPVTRVPEASRGGHARIRPRTRDRLCSSVSARDTSCPRKRNTAHVKSSCTDRGSQAIEAATHRRGQRNRHRLVPASSGAKAPLACEDRTLVRVCPRVVSGCRSRQATPGSREACLPLAAGRVDGDLALGQDPQGSPGVNEAARSGFTVAKPRILRSPEPGVREGVAGRGSLPDGRHPGPFTSSRRSHDRARGGLGGLRRHPHHASGWVPAEEATGMSEVRSARITMGTKTPTAMIQKQGRAAHRSESPWM